MPVGGLVEDLRGGVAVDGVDVVRLDVGVDGQLPVHVDVEARVVHEVEAPGQVGQLAQVVVHRGEEVRQRLRRRRRG